MRRFLAGPAVVIAAIVGGLAILGVVLSLVGPFLLSLLGETQRDFARQGETVKVDGGNLTALRWCAFVECPEGVEGTVRVWVKACATKEGWDIDEASFWVVGTPPPAGDSEVADALTPSPATLGYRTLRAGACVEGAAAFNLGESPTQAWFEGHGHRVRWDLRGEAKIPLTKAVLTRFPAGERRLLVRVEKLYRHANLNRLLPENAAITAQTLRSLASVGEECDRPLRAGGPGRFGQVRKQLENACERLRTAGEDFKRALAAAPDAAPIAGTPQAREFDKAFDDGLEPLQAGVDLLARARGRALVIMHTLRSGCENGARPEQQWPPGTTLIAFETDCDGNAEIYVMSTDGSGRRNLTKHPEEDGQAAWSPDGTEIAFTSDRDGGADIFVMNVDGGGLGRLTREAADEPLTDDAFPAWSPDGKKIAFASDRDGDVDIYAMNAYGSGVRRLTDTADRDYEPDWSPDGKRIAFTSERDGNEEIYVMNADGSGQRRLTRNPEGNANPAWSPDGKRIAFTSGRDGNFEIYVMNADGSGQRNLTRSPRVDTFPDWSPDGVRIVFQSRADGNRDIYVMNADGGGVRRLAKKPHYEVEPAWQPAPKRRP